MKKSTQKKIIAVLAALMALLMLLPILANIFVSPSYAVTQGEIDSLKGDAKDLKAQQQELKEQLKEIAADKNKALERKKNLENQIYAVEQEIANIAAQIEKYNELIAQKEEELAQSEREQQEQYELFCQRVRLMEEQGEVSYWSILFSSSDFADLLDRFMMVEEIIDYDNAVMERLIAMQKKIEADKASLEQSRREQEEAKAEEEAAKAELQSLKKDVEKTLAEIQDKEEEVKKAEQELQNAAAKMDAEIRRKEAQLAAQLAAANNPIVSESGFQWPLPGRYRLSSLFAGRVHPITGKYHHHTGIDIPAPGGTPILAAKSGVVLTSERGSSYGNYVVISHGGGQTTLYAHMSSRAVSEGQTVKQGQTIGYVGSTGSSTGNHLHLEVRINGTRKDPQAYFPDIKFSY